jgi:hypothetical protein
LREVHDDVPEVDPGGAGPQRLPGRDHEIGLVVPPGGQVGAGLLAQPHHVGGPLAGGGQPLATGGRQIGELGVGRDQRLLGGRVRGDRAEQTGVGVQRPSQRGGDHRRRHRSSAGGGEAGGAQQLGQPVRGEEADPDGAEAPAGQRPGHPGGQGPSSGDADVVAGDDDRDRRQGLVGLGRSHGSAQGFERGPPVGGRRHIHASDRTHGV